MLFLSSNVLLAAFLFASATANLLSLTGNLLKLPGKIIDELSGQNANDKSKMDIYAENSKKIIKHNKLFSAGKVSFKTAINKFAFLDHETFLKSVTGFRLDLKSDEGEQRESYPTPTAEDMASLPDTVDWRTKGAVTPVKDQGTCGSCYAFSAVGSLESQTFIHHGKLISLSEQQLVDCSHTYGNEGCDGGFEDNAFYYIRDNGGIDTEESYPYNVTDPEVGPCRFNPDTVGATVKGVMGIPYGDEDALKHAVATVGPVSVAIHVGKLMQFYDSGIYIDPTCSHELNHAVIVVGYGTENNLDYWLVRNSWGADWGMKGYIKMLRGGFNHCGIALDASYPLV